MIGEDVTMSLSRREIAKDAVQQSAEAAITTASRISAIVFDSVRQIATEVGSFGTEIFEIREAGNRASEQVEEDDNDRA